MNSQSENNTWLENLIQSNGQAMEKIRETPYQPIFYAVPKEWIENWMKLLEQAVEFQPTLYRLISLLSTRKELEQMQVRQRQLLQAEKQDTLATIRSALTEKEEPSAQEEEYKEFLAELDREYEYEEEQTWQQTM